MPMPTEHDPVAIEQIDGEWAVQIFENGEVTQKMFDTEEFAENFATGQRLRLNPPPHRPRRPKSRPV